MDWKPINEAPMSGIIYAKNNDGEEAWTWHDGDEWVRQCWRETSDQQEYRSEEWWAPIAYAPGV